MEHCAKFQPMRVRQMMETHSVQMDQLERGGFVVRDETTLEPHGRSLLLGGTIYCNGGMYVDVTEVWELSGSGACALVQRGEYSYNVAITQEGNVFRYDSAHSSHHSEPHAHRYDVLSGDKTGTVDFCYDPCTTPTLYEALREAEEWYYSHMHEMAGRFHRLYTRQGNKRTA